MQFLPTFFKIYNVPRLPSSLALTVYCNIRNIRFLRHVLRLQDGPVIEFDTRCRWKYGKKTLSGLGLDTLRNVEREVLLGTEL